MHKFMLSAKIMTFTNLKIYSRSRIGHFKYTVEEDVAAAEARVAEKVFVLIKFFSNICLMCVSMCPFMPVYLCLCLCVCVYVSWSKALYGLTRMLAFYCFCLTAKV